MSSSSCRSRAMKRSKSSSGDRWDAAADMGAGRAPCGGRAACWGRPPEVRVSGGVADAVLRQLGEQLVCLLRPLRVLLLDLLDELGDVAVARRITQKLVVDLRALQGVVLDRDEVVDDVAGSGAGHSAPSIGFSRTPSLCPRGRS